MKSTREFLAKEAEERRYSLIFASHVSENHFERGSLRKHGELYNFYPGRRAKVTGSKIKLRSKREENHFSSNQRGLLILIQEIKTEKGKKLY